MHIWMKTFCTQSSLLLMAMILAGCSSNPVAQLGSLTRLSEASTPNVNQQAGQVRITAGQLVSQVKATASHAAASLRQPAPNSPEALHRDELIARGELPDPAEQQRPAAPVDDLHAATIDNCPVVNAAGNLTQSDIPKGISECELLSIKGRPKEIRRLSMPTEPRRVLLSYLDKRGQAAIFEFVKNRLTTIY